MKRYRVRLGEDAETDLLAIYRFVRDRSASMAVASAYISRIKAFLQSFETFPERGTLRDIREGLRIVGFERASASLSSFKTAMSWFFLSFTRGSALNRRSIDRRNERR